MSSRQRADGVRPCLPSARRAPAFRPTGAGSRFVRGCQAPSWLLRSSGGGRRCRARHPARAGLSTTHGYPARSCPQPILSRLRWADVVRQDSELKAHEKAFRNSCEFGSWASSPWRQCFLGCRRGNCMIRASPSTDPTNHENLAESVICPTILLYVIYYCSKIGKILGYVRNVQSESRQLLKVIGRPGGSYGYRGLRLGPALRVGPVF